MEHEYNDFIGTYYNYICHCEKYIYDNNFCLNCIYNAEGQCLRGANVQIREDNTVYKEVV